MCGCVWVCVRDWQSERREWERERRRVRKRRREEEGESVCLCVCVCVIEISFSHTFHRFPPTFFVTIKRPNRSQRIPRAHFIYTCRYSTLGSRHMSDFDTQYYDIKTVKPVYNDRPRNPVFVAVVDEWSLFRGRFVIKT